MKARTHKNAVGIVTIAIVFLLIILIGFDLFPYTTGNDEFVPQSQANLQVARAEALAKDALMLSYPSFHLPAVSQMQIVEPMLEKTQAGLLKGDAVLGLPPPTDDVKLVLDQAEKPYEDVTSAIQKLLASTTSAPDALEIGIIVQSVDNYAGSMYQVVQLLQQHAESRNLTLTVFKVTLKMLLIIVIAGHYLVAGRQILTKLVQMEESNQATDDQEVLT